MLILRFVFRYFSQSIVRQPIYSHDNRHVKIQKAYDLALSDQFALVSELNKPFLKFK